ncbi:MAG TPA: glycosyltransferase family 39 protein [Stellaceae bacterium]|nr:glycosyltransferase family 39 protein [Stellaceae bacterium]
MPPRPARTILPDTDEERMMRWTLWTVFAVTVARLVWVALDRTDLYPDEAQYWVWARHLDWGYYSKPPVVAWLIGLSSRLFGDTGPAVRLPAPLLHFATAMTVYGCARRLYDLRTGFWSAVTYATLPGVFVSAMIMSTDAPMLLCWAIAFYAFIRARDSDDRRWWLLVGIAIGIGLLSKYAMAYWLLCGIVFLAAIPEERCHLSMFFGATALGLVIYLPNFLWNYGNGFVSYHHTEANASLGGPLFHPEHLLEFFGAQFGVFGPLLFAVLIGMIVLAGRTLKDRRAALLVCFTLPPLALMLGLSLLSRAEANWAAPAYIAATILVVGWLLAEGRRIVIIVSIALHVLAALLVAVGLRNVAAIAGVTLPVKYDPLHRLQGWRSLGRAITAQMAQHPGAILMADDRELLAALMFYVQPHPLTALEWDPDGAIHDQFELTQQPTLDRGADFLLVSQNPRNIAPILARFTAASPPQTITIFIGRSGAMSSPAEQRHYTVYFLKGFKGFP